MTSASTPIALSRCDPFYFDDSQVVLKVDQQIYKVHRYFLVRESEFFKDMFSLPQGDSAGVEGVDDKRPILIPNTTIAEFKSLLRFFYFGMHDDYIATVDDWIAMLSISTRLIFSKVRERAIKELTSCLEEINPFDLIGLAVKYDVQQWLKPAYRKIVTRHVLIAYEEAEKIPFLMTFMLMRSREKYWKNFPRVLENHDSILDSEIRLMDLPPLEELRGILRKESYEGTMYFNGGRSML